MRQPQHEHPQLQQRPGDRRVELAEAGPGFGARPVHQPRVKAMRYTDAQIEGAARRFEQLADQLDPATAEAEDLSDLRAIAEAAEQVRRHEALVTARVAEARA